jgi:hypothetical protein
MATSDDNISAITDGVGSQSSGYTILTITTTSDLEVSNQIPLVTGTLVSGSAVSCISENESSVFEEKAVAFSGTKLLGELTNSDDEENHSQQHSILRDDKSMF